MTKMTGARTGLAAMALAVAFAAPGWAQETYIQLEAKRTLAEAREAARRHGARVPEIAGYEAVGGWYVVALGPLPASDARDRLRRLRAARAVPSDAFLTEGDLYRDRFWPAGAAPLAERQAAPEAAPEPIVAAPTPRAPVAEETPRQALEAETALSRREREAVQAALEGAGFYEGAIDAAFGRGTRNAMAAWQQARGVEVTGVLTTAQRAALMGEYEAVFDGLGMARVTDAEAGISVEMPTERLALEGRETPFARYAATDGGPARVVLVSQEGDAAALAALYEVMRSLDIVPREGKHEIDGEVFRLRGRDDERLVRGFARLRDGEVKGLLLAWPAGEEERFERLWERMRASFEREAGAVLGPEHATPAPEQRLDRLAGLELRTPELARTGFFVDAEGAVLTTAEVAECREVLIDDAHPATVAWSDDRVALLRPLEPLAPSRVAALASEPGRLGSEVSVAGFPFGGALGRASVTGGRLEDLRGLEGEETLDRYALSVEEGDFGGPVLGPDGAVAGMLLPPAQDGRSLPPGVAFGVDAGRLAAVLDEAGASPEVTLRRASERGAEDAAEIAVLVTCHG